MSIVGMGSEAAAAATEVEMVACECCGLAEECTPEYIEVVRRRFGGWWVCGLCGEAVQDEIDRASGEARPITYDEAVRRHAGFYTAFRSAPPLVIGAADRLTAAVGQLMRRSLSSPKATPKVPSAAAASSSGSVLAGV